MTEDEFYGKSISLADPNFSEKVSRILDIKPTPTKTGGKSMSKLEIEDGIRVKVEFTYLESPSNYNRNYYTYKDKLLFGLSDDDCNTNWYMINGNSKPIFLGYSDVREDPEVLHRQEQEAY